MARWVTSRQKSRAGPLTRCAASSGPHVHALAVGPGRARRGTRRRAASRPWARKAKSRARTPMWATWRSRAVGWRATPRASATSWPCAHVSISRAVAIDGGAIGGPNHGMRPGRHAEQRGRAAARGRRATRPATRLAAALRRRRRSSRRTPCRRSARRASPGRRPASVAARAASSSVQPRWAIWSAIVHPGDGVGRRQSGSVRSPTSASSTALSAARSASSEPRSAAIRPRWHQLDKQSSAHDCFSARTDASCESDLAHNWPVNAAL